MKSLLLVALLFLSKNAFAYPEMVRHGYNNCTSCHYSPNGGGILTEYGRELSAELLSAYSKEGETQAFYGILKPPTWLAFGGDFRALQLVRDTPTVVEGKFIVMQADLEAAITKDKFVLVGTVGRQELGSGRHTFREYITSRRHYIMYKPTNTLTVRGGKFTQAYGLNTADHAISIKRGLNWDQGGETYNVETSFLTEGTSTYLTAVFGRPDSIKLDSERGVSLSSAAYVSEKHKLGMSYHYGETSSRKRHVAGPFGIIGLPAGFYWFSEFDFQHSRVWSFVDYQRLGYEFTKGAHLFVTQEYARPQLGVSETALPSYGVGARFLPRPHFEVEGMVQKYKSPDALKTFNTLFWVVFHYYI